MNLIVMNWAGSSLTGYLQKSDVVTLQGACEQVIRSKNSKDWELHKETKLKGKFKSATTFLFFA